jgi:uracil-DNA glycosylase family 4
MSFNRFGGGERAKPAPEPDILQVGHPKSVNTTRRHDGILFVAGEGKTENVEIMFVQTSLQEQEAMETQTNAYGGDTGIRDKPRYLKGSAGIIMKDTALQRGINIDDHYFTALCKWLLPKEHRNKPKKEHIALAAPVFHEEIERIKPKLIVCFGKPAFDTLFDFRISASDLEGGWFYNERFKCKVYLMPNITLPVFKPEYIERFSVDFDQIKRMLDQTRGVEIQVLPRTHTVLYNTEQVANAVAHWGSQRFPLFSVDCEWGGNNHVDGQLRTIQFCWKPGEAVALRFMDDKRNFVFDQPYGKVGEILASHLNQPFVKYIGHHIAADYPWMHTWLGLDYYDKTFFDTEFGLQTADESAPLGLEQVALRFTDMGRYDLDLMMWLKENPQEEGAGFAYVPDPLLLPYSMCDVDAPMRAYPFIMSRLMSDGVLDYFFGIFLPFVSNVFTTFSLVGLPMNIQRMDELRMLFAYARDRLDEKLRIRIFQEAKVHMVRELSKIANVEGILKGREIIAALEAHDAEKALNIFKGVCGIKNVAKLMPFYEHLRDAPGFNIRSVDMMRRWLFQVQGHTPVKSTNNKEKGMPSVAWEKVMAYPPERQKEFVPSTDKQTLTILGEKDSTINELLKVNAVGNLCKAFLKEPTYDEDGKVTRENGLHFWLCSDRRVHGQTSTTETGRPRAWKPNVLNWPSYVNARISEGVGHLFAELHEKGELPEQFRHYVTRAIEAKEADIKIGKGKDPLGDYIGKQIPSIRGCVDASTIPPLPGSVGWCLVESDYATAEIRGLAFMSGDENLIRLMTEKDPQFGLVLEGGDEVPVRIKYDDDCGIPSPNCRAAAIMTIMKEGKVIRAVTPEELLRNPDGSIKHPSYDLHWSLAEWVKEEPREWLIKKAHRDGIGKVGNFSTAYGATSDTLERKIESDTGKKPEPGTGQRILDSLQKRQPKAVRFLEEQEEVPKFPGYQRAESGRKRRYKNHGAAGSAISGYEKKKILSGQGREARNFYMQESVAAAASRSGNWLLKHYREHGFHARPMTILYDSVVTLCPIEERFEVMKLHELYMATKNTWHNHGREWNYPAEHELNYAWSTRPTKAQRKLLDDPKWNSHASWLKSQGSAHAAAA